MIGEILIIFALLVMVFAWLKHYLFWLYVWQNYEYRYDRLRAYVASSRFGFDWLNVINPLELFFIRRPRLTAKTFLLVVMLIQVHVWLFARGLRPLAWVTGLNHHTLWLMLLVLGLLFLAAPVLVLGLVLIFAFPSYLAKSFLVILAKQKIRRNPHLLVIGVTGSYGKSSTKEILYHLLQTKYRTVRTKGSINTTIGVAKTILKDLHDNTQVFIVEMGAYRSGEIKSICRIVKPQISLITGINEQHLALFGSMKAIQEAKYELVASLPASGLAFFNLSDSRVESLYRRCGVTKFAYRQPREKIKSRIEADFLQVNINGAVMVAKQLKVEPKMIKKALLKIPLSKNITQKKVGINRSVIWDNSYNTNPNSFLSALQLLRSAGRGKSIVITPGIIELGLAEERVHKQLAEAIAPVAGTLVLTNPNFYRHFKKWLPSEVKLLVAKRRQNWKILIKPGSRILLEGRIPAWIYNQIVVG